VPAIPGQEDCSVPPVPGDPVPIGTQAEATPAAPEGPDPAWDWALMGTEGMDCGTLEAARQAPLNGGALDVETLAELARVLLQPAVSKRSGKKRKRESGARPTSAEENSDLPWSFPPEQARPGIA
jgi:hypothetical protein